MDSFEDIVKPTLVLDEAIARRNIARMAEKARRQGIRFRPHFKTHQSAAIGEWFRGEGVSCITVSSVDMAAYFSRSGWDDITIAFPANLRQMGELSDLADRVRLGLLVESVESVLALRRGLNASAAAWIKIDVGSGRTGIPWDQPAAVAEVLDAIRQSPNLEPRGLLTHAGHTYHAASRAEIEQIYATTRQRLHGLLAFVETQNLASPPPATHSSTVETQNLASPNKPHIDPREGQPERFGSLHEKDTGVPEAETQHLASLQEPTGNRYAPLQISVGDTPACSVVDDLSGVDELRPGNFIFYDAEQYLLGSCAWEDVAVAVACPVAALHPERQEVVIYGGAIHLSKDFMDYQGHPAYGLAALPDGDHWGPPVEGAYVRSLSQEHGIVHVPQPAFDKIRVGGLLFVIPAHSCLTVTALGRYRTLSGEMISTMNMV